MMIPTLPIVETVDYLQESSMTFLKLFKTYVIYVSTPISIIFLMVSLPVRSYQTEVATRTMSVTSRSSMLLSVIQLSKNSMVSCDGDSTCPLLKME